MDRVRVLVAEDEPAVRQAIIDLISEEPALELVGSTDDAQEAIDLTRIHQPDVALINVTIPGGGGPRAAREIRQLSPKTRVVAMSAMEDRGAVTSMLRAGAVSCLVKGGIDKEVIGTLIRTAYGGTLSAEVDAGVIRELIALLDRTERLADSMLNLDLDVSNRRFLETLSHELLAPLSVIHAASQLLVETPSALRSQEIAQLVIDVGQASARVGRLFGDVETATRLDLENSEVTTKRVPASGIISQAADEFPWDRHRLELPDPRKAATKVLADRDLAVRALIIAIDSALALSEDDPIRVDVTRAPGELRFGVTYSGPTLPEHLRRHLSDARDHESGTGALRLRLARRIMSAHGGRIQTVGRRGRESAFLLTFRAPSSMKIA